MKISSHQIRLFLVILIWVSGFFLRIYRQTDLLGFYFDQGRDAKVAHDIISGSNLPAIGPTTGIDGLYLGPFWFYLITPGYLIANGNPAVASYFIIFLESLTIPLLYFLLSKYGKNQNAGIIAAFFWSFSHNLIRYSRWFSNPTPLPFFVILMMIITLNIFQNKKHWQLPLLSLLFGLSLQLEAASAIFFIPILLLFFIINYKNSQKIKIKEWLLSFVTFALLLLPQAAFEIKNKFIVTKTFLGFLTGKVNSDTGKSWAIPTIDFIKNRVLSYYHSFFSKLDTNITWGSLILFIIFLIGAFYIFRKQKKSLLSQLILIWLFVPLFLLLFFVGNYGNLYDYYLIGFFPAFIILFSLVITLPNNKVIMGILTATCLIIFVNGNFIHLKNYVSAGTNGPEHITLGNELAAVEHVCQTNPDGDFHLDIYVPPVITHSYDYLFAWQNRLKLCHQPTSERQSHVNILYEVDPPHPERLSNWLIKYQNYPVISRINFGGVFVETRSYPKE